MSDPVVAALISAGVAAVVAILGTIVSTRIALQGLEAQAKIKKDELEAAAVRLRADAEGDRFAVSSLGSTAVMVETATGKTWLLHHSADGSTSAWLPAERIDDSDEARKWLAK